MDETTIRLFYDAAEGVIASEPIAQAGRKGRLAQQATRGQTRGALSLIALLCDDSSVQPRLPQYVIGNEHVLQASLVADLQNDGRLLPNVRLLRRKSAWVNDAALAAIARHWGQVLVEVSADRQPILLLDACSAHLGPKFLAMCGRWNIWVVCVPARLTWLMQPADTHCFALLKALLRKRFHEALIAGTDGKVTVKDILLHMNESIRRILQGRRWTPAFEGNGWDAGQQRVRQKILHMLEWDETPAVPSSLPSLQEFEAIFPRNRKIPIARLLVCHRWSAHETPPSPPPVLPPVDEPIGSHGVWHGRLRSSSRCFTEPPAAVAHSEPGQPSLSSLPPPPEPWRPSAREPLPRPLSTLRLHPVGRPLFRRRRRVEVEAASPL